ncbi:MAG: isochorismatase family protein [Patescibacteria group bacterium]
MPKPINRQQLLDEAQKEYEALGKQVASFTPEEMVRPGVIGVWSIKDILAHLLEWQRMYMGWYEAGLRGQKPATPAKGYNWSELPALNQDIYERYKNAQLDAVRSQLEASHKHMLDGVGPLPEDELFTPGRHKWTGISTLAAYVNSCTGAHYRWARTGIRRGTREWAGEAPAVKPVESPAVNTHVAAKPSKAAGKPALLVIDVQRELFAKTLPIYDEDRLLANVRLLADKAHAAKVPVFWIQHSSEKTLVEGTAGWKLHPAFIPLKSDNFIRKRHGNAFEDTPLKAELDALHVRRVVVAGLVTHGCVQATCNGGHDLGYDVVLVKDAHSNYNVKARDVINEWNTTLSHGVVQLQSAAEVDFGAPGTR